MGLAERRAAKEFETNRYPAVKKDIDAAAKFDVPVEVKWDSLAVAEYAHMYEEAWLKVYFRPLIDALKAITVDAMGSDALKASLKRIVIQNMKDNSSSSYWAIFTDGTLTLDHAPVSNVDYIEDRKTQLQKVLEEKL